MLGGVITHNTLESDTIFIPVPQFCVKCNMCRIVETVPHIILWVFIRLAAYTGKQKNICGWL